MPLQDFSIEQRTAALAAGRQTRARSAVVWAELNAHTLTLCTAMNDPDSANLLRSRRVKHLVGTTPRYGVKRTATLLRDLGIDGDRRWRALGPNQHDSILAAVGCPTESAGT